MLGLSVWYRLKEVHGETIELPENCYRGDYIREIAADAEVKLASELASSTEKEAVDLLARFAGDFILNWIRSDLADFRVTLETWFSQREMEDSGAVDQVVDDYRSKDLVYEKDGALWLRTSQYGDSDDRVVVKQDGSYTYRTPDIAYHCDKYRRGYEQMFVLLGPDHHAHTITMKAALRALGLQDERLKHIIIQHCTLYRGGEPLKMSTRRATYVTLREIMDAVGVDAARFFFLNRSAESHLDFDLELAVKQASDNPVFYLQYASARCASILAKALEEGFFGANEFHEAAFIPTEADIALMETDEVELLRSLGRFPLTIQRAASNAEAMKVINYLTESVENFHNYYQRRRVMTDDKAVSRARLAVVSAFRQVLANGLGLLGVSAPVRM
jgi:arginyl-tRNA synthetase